MKETETQEESLHGEQSRARNESKPQRLTQGVWEAVLEPVFPYTGTTLNMGADSENKPPPPASLQPGKHQRNTTNAPAGDSGDVTCIHCSSCLRRWK